MRKVICKRYKYNTLSPTETSKLQQLFNTKPKRQLKDHTMRFLRQCERCDKPRAKLLPCGHIAHYKCLVARTRCPTCNVSVDKSHQPQVTDEDNLKSVLSVTKKRQQQAGRKFGIILYQVDEGSKFRTPLLDVLLQLQEKQGAPDFANFIATQLTQVLVDDNEPEDQTQEQEQAPRQSPDFLFDDDFPAPLTVQKPSRRRRFQVFTNASDPQSDAQSDLHLAETQLL